ncbi:MAG TPA: DUF5990 family protein, partial [Bryobacteraceae bacterium]|nr:DUF5990 family protein [Bryobacteraceae bacterium]
QKGRGSAYETVQKKRSEGLDLAFEFTVGVKAGRGGAAPVFTGPLVQGPPGQRFVYLDIGTYAGQADSCWSRRLKVPLGGISAEMTVSRAVLETRVPGTGRTADQAVPPFSHSMAGSFGGSDPEIWRGGPLACLDPVKSAQWPDGQAASPATDSLTAFE